MVDDVGVVEAASSLSSQFTCMLAIPQVPAASDDQSAPQRSSLLQVYLPALMTLDMVSSLIRQLQSMRLH